MYFLRVNFKLFSDSPPWLANARRLDFSSDIINSMNGSGERKEFSPKSVAILATLLFHNQDIRIASKQDLLDAADELENNPPPELTPEDVLRFAAMFRGEDIDYPEDID